MDYKQSNNPKICWSNSTMFKCKSTNQPIKNDKTTFLNDWLAPSKEKVLFKEAWINRVFVKQVDTV